MNRKEELNTLKERVINIKTRIKLLNCRIADIHQGRPQTSGLKAVVNSDKCIGCGICAETCPQHAIFIDNIAHVNLGLCIGCGLCVNECPRRAISLPPSGNSEQVSASDTEGRAYL